MGGRTDRPGVLPVGAGHSSSGAPGGTVIAPGMWNSRAYKVVAAAMKPRVPVLARPVVLLVEDEPLVRTVQVDILREADFWVLEAQDADEAFEILRQRQDVSVVLT